MGKRTLSAAVTASQNIKERDYWLNQLSGDLEKSTFPYDTNKVNTGERHTAAVKFRFNQSTAAKMVRLSNESDVRLFIILAAGLVLLIDKYTYKDNNDIIIGTGIYKQQGDAQLINTILALRNRIHKGMTFKELLMQVKQTHFQAVEHQNYPFETLLYQLNMPVSGEDFPLFEIVILLENIQDKKYIRHTHPNMLFSFLRSGEDIEGVLEYNAGLYEKAAVKRIINHLENLFHAALLNVDRRVAAVDMLPGEEKRELLIDFNDTKAGYPGDKLIHDLFEEAVEKTPHNIAAVYEDRQLTYEKLNRQANRLAAVLRAKALTPNRIAAIVVDKSPEMVIALLGVLKAGGAYLPIIPEFPQERTAYMIRESRARVILTRGRYAAKLKDIQEVINIENDETYAGETDTGNLERINKTGDLAYVIYTSGSTGAPKGVLVEHANVVNLLTWYGRNYRLQKGTHVLQLTDFTFDPSVEQVLGTLAHCGTLYVVPTELAADSSRFCRFIEERQIRLMNFVPTVLKQLLCPVERLKSLQIVISGGERLDDSLKNEILKKGYMLYNQYGPTEITVDALAVECSLASKVVLGKPISNCKAYILGLDNGLMPLGVPGELCIGGPGVTRGYLNSPGLTAEKFTANPFEKGGRIYRTGDIAGWRTGGNIEFLGRADRQLKIRGYRIETGEIERRLLSHESIKEAVVLPGQDHKKNSCLAAYYVIKDERLPTGELADGPGVNELRQYLSVKLPGYMIPAYFIPVDGIPLTPNGKIDFRALPVPGDKAAKEYAAPGSPLEKRLAGIWSEVLPVEKEKIGIDDNFFESGGHSLLATVLTAKMHRTFDTEITLAELFTNPTIRMLSGYIESTAKKTPYSSIKPVAKKEYYPLSSAQKRMYLIQQINPESKEYNLPGVVVRVLGSLERHHLEDAFKYLVKRHESFRTSFMVIDNQPVQRIHETMEFEMDYYETTGEEAQDLVNRCIRPFDLSRPPLLRAALIKTGAETHILAVDMHHIITDAISEQVFIKELAALYRGETLPGISITYKDFSQWHNRMILAGEIKKQEEYWLKEFAGELPMSDLPLDYARPAKRSFEGDNLVFLIEKEETRRLNRLAARENVTLYMLLLAVFNVFLHKLSGREDIIVGADNAGRGHAELQTVIGMFVNSFAMRNYPAPHKTFSVFLAEVKDRTIRAFDNQDYQFENLVEKAAPHRDPAHNPLYDVMFSFHNIEKVRPADVPQQGGGDLTFVPYAFDYKVAKFDLMLHGEEVDESIRFLFEYCTKLFKKDTIERFSGYFRKIIARVLENPAIPLAEIGILSREEKKQLLVDFNGAQVELPPGMTVLKLIENQAAKTPDRSAVTYNGSELTFGQLDENAGGRAAGLRTLGIERDRVVGILMNRSLEMMESILAVWKAGGAYLPIAPGYPEERIEYMLADSGAKTLLTTDKLPNGSSPSTLHPPPPTSLAYIIYTSGSTGKPKGAMVDHTGMLNHMLAKIDDLRPTHRSIMAQNASHTFDISVWQFFAVLIVGGKTVIYTDDLILEPERFISRVARDHVTILEVVPSYLSVILDYIEESGADRLLLDYLMVTGEEVKPPLVGRWFKRYPAVPMVNAYGPTEASDDITHYIMDKPPNMDRVPIGRPLRNFNIYIVDNHMNLCPVGVKGEIVAAGTGVGRGYLNNPELTAEKYNQKLLRGVQGGGILEKSPPGRRRPRGAGSLLKIYKTGDLGRRLPDGTIEFFGRKDYQLKMRGFRIELGEIENRLIEHPDIKEAVVIDKKDQAGNTYLCAYVVPYSAGLTGIKEYLSGGLPGYMVPSYIVEMERMPLTPNGKIHRKALPEPGRGTREQRQYTAPRDPVETKCVDVWSEVLGLEKSRVGIDDNFFDSGGHSLKAITLLSKLHKHLEVKIPLVTIFNSPTIRELALYIKGAAQTPYTAVYCTAQKEYHALSSAQKRLYIVQQMDPHSTVYNIPRMYRLENPDKDKLSETFRKLIRGHESLRTSFHIIEDEPVQKIHDAGAVEFAIEPRAAAARFVRPFDLSRIPLLRVGLTKLGKENYILMVDMHHIISDGISHDILVEDFAVLYEGRELSPLRLRYKDYAEWQNSPGQQQLLKQQENYWLKIFEEEAPVLDLPIDYPRPAIQSFEGGVANFVIGKEETELLKELASQEKVTLYFLLLAVYYVFLFKITGREDIVVGTPEAGRSHPDLERIIGMFVNMLVLRNSPRGEKVFRQFLQEVGKRGVAAFENRDYPFEDLVARVVSKKDLSRNPLFDTAFGFEILEMGRGREPAVGRPQRQKRDGPFDAPPRVKMEPYKYEYGNARFDLSLYGVDAGEGESLVFSFEYCTKLFRKETIRRFIDYYRKILSLILEKPGIKLWEMRIIPEEEKKRLLYDLNDTFTGHPGNKTLRRLFDEQSEKNRDSIVLAGAETGTRNIYITYNLLNKKSNQLARLLREKGLPAGNIAGIMMDRSLEMITAMLGILKAGAAYLPIDPGYPPERIEYMTADSGAGILLTGSDSQLSIVNRQSSTGSSKAHFHHSSFIIHHPDLAYIIYTSGSTGKPKGVMVEHRSVVRLVENSNFIDFTGEDKLLLTGAMVFDITTFEIWAPLLNGFTLFLADQEVILDAERLGEVLLKNKISILHLIPQLFNQLAARRPTLFDGLKYLLVGGDMVRPKYVNAVRIRCKNLKILHMYGPTENTTFSTFLPVDKDYNISIPIGKPISNSTVYIVDKSGQLAPFGAVGELCVGGEGIARGYLNNPELTAERFCLRRPGGKSFYLINQKFCGGAGGGFSKEPPARRRQYKTGDLARWLPGGNIEFLGRQDHQVKIRGIRIELGEIENRLLKHDEVKEAVIVALEDKGDKCLAAYWVPVGFHTGSSPSYVPKFREYLAKTLPENMIPSYFVKIETVPLTANGKIDRKALPGLEPGEMSENYAAPRDEVENALARIWSELLGIEKETISIDANFYELGGHSLKATIMASRVHRQFNVKIPLVKIFTSPRLKDLAQYIKGAAADRFVPLEPTEKKDYYDVSPAQKRVYLMQQMETGGTGYNIPQVNAFNRDEHIDGNKLKEIMVRLIRGHESLRTSFVVVDGKPVQKIDDNVEFHLEDLNNTIQDFVRPFDLSCAPLLRMGLINTPDQGNFLLLDVHHIISDEFSREILVKDFMILLDGQHLPPLRLQYRDYSQWQNRLSGTGKLKQQGEYWLNLFNEETPPLNLPTDYPGPEKQDFSGETLEFRIGAKETAALNNLALREGMTLYMVLLAILHILLSKISGREDIVIGTPVAGRRHADLQQIIGMLVNTLPLRNRHTGENSFLDFLRAVKKNTLEAFENQDYPFEKLVEQVMVSRDKRHNPLFDVMFVYQEIGGAAAEADTGRDQNQYRIENRTAKFDMTWRAAAAGDILYLFVEYSTKLFKKKTIEKFIAYFTRIVSSLLENPHQKISAIQVSSESERKEKLSLLYRDLEMEME